MNATQERQLRRLIADTHIEAVIQVCAAYCHEQAAHAQATPALRAIGQEWTRAADLLEQAASEVQA